MKNKPYPLYNIVPNISNLQKMVQIRAEKTPDKVAFSYSAKQGTTENKTCKEFYQNINALGSYFFANNIHEKHIAVIGENSYLWLVAFLAVINGGNIAVPIDKDLPLEDVDQLLHFTDCEFLLLSDTYKHLAKHFKGKVIFFSEFENIFKQTEILPEYVNYPIDDYKMAAIFLTSGTIGKPKGVMLSHNNMAFNIVGASSLFILKGNTVSVLPFHHTFGLIIGVFAVFNYGYMTFINTNLRSVTKDIKTIKPHTLFVVPLFLESFYKTINRKIKDTGKAKKIESATQISSILLKLGIDTRRLLFKEILESFGGNLKYIICGGAPLNSDLVQAFQQWDINILNGYGITECSPVISVNRNFYGHNGSVGQIVPKTEVKISKDDEVLVKGPHVMLGYYKNSKETKKALQDEWFHTGDLGYINDQGFLFLTGRKKNLIILSNGENLSPEELEDKINKDSHVQEVVVYSKGKKIIAEIFPDEEYAENKLYFESLIRTVNKNEPRYKIINSVKLRDREFEKNSTKKIIRSKIKH